MFKPLLFGIGVLALTGCSTLSGGKAPSCSGYEQRPLNKSMWNWQDGQPQVGPTYVPPPADPKHPQNGATQPASRVAHFDDASSRKSCGVG
jgi:type IV secretion system protein VirB7